MKIPSLSIATGKLLQSEYTIAWRQDWSVLKASGPGIRKYLQGQITQDMGKLTPGKGIHSFILTPQGKAVSELYLLEGNSDELILLTPSNYAVPAVTRLRQFALGYQLRIGVVDACSVLEIQGVQVAGKLQRFGFPDAENEWLTTRHAGDIHALMMSKKPHGFWLIGSTSELEIIARSNMLDKDAVEAMRILQGIPRFGTDWDEKTYPMNANLIEFDGVSFDKGCYVGQEVTSRMHWRGGIKKRFYRVKLGGAPEAHPCPVLTTAKIGMLTSAATDAEGICFGIAHLPIEVVESDAPLSLENNAEVNIIEACHA
ncbi:MAG: folate-binding protein YgfZ [Zetaproteobacteria bacterium]|nr:MAG: folate-binding protein YgfZ [Zetaproteobacteria bacterium]